ncbi:DUF2213 domain-containing protein [Haloarcula sp. JP-Z28]|uniref:DUF2213 domain-containing protein n=1 Tax=Haloarcula sp. JP-Z28 TaxID=2716715 RepID=UPI00140467BC|nr:DUF2213 domain-containing protein [Haloarcula sp. JP-Z28]NHN65258.1 DUF2213 domain-containing protein [Haloarcula sp. JP-Z28]
MSEKNIYWFEDSATVDFSPIASDGTVLNDSSGTVEPIEVNDPRTDFFETDQFHRYDATVARPIEQTYTVGDGEQLTLKKPTEELKTSLWQIDNCPWTVGHPPSKRITDYSQMRGFWRHPYYDSGQKATLYIPSNDADAVSTVDETKSISIGFRASVELTDGVSTAIDGYQRNLIYDHIASVRKGRCSVEDGCGIHTDSIATPIESGYIHGDSSFKINSFGDSCDCDGTSNLEGGLEILTVDAVRGKNDAVDSRISELEKEVDELSDQLAERRRKLRKSVQIDSAETPDDAVIREGGKFDLRKNTK